MNAIAVAISVPGRGCPKGIIPLFKLRRVLLSCPARFVGAAHEPPQTHAGKRKNAYTNRITQPYPRARHASTLQLNALSPLLINGFLASIFRIPAYCMGLPGPTSGDRTPPLHIIPSAAKVCMPAKEKMPTPTESLSLTRGRGMSRLPSRCIFLEKRPFSAPPFAKGGPGGIYLKLLNPPKSPFNKGGLLACFST